MSTEKQNPEQQELEQIRQEASEVGKTVLAEVNPDLRARMQASAEKFGWPYARLFPLIGAQVMTPQGSGKLLTVQARQCEISPGRINDKTFRVKPDHVCMMGGEPVVTHEEQEAMDRYMDLQEHTHLEQRKCAKR